MTTPAEKLVHRILRGRVVLIIDDEAFMRSIVRSYLAAIPDIIIEEATEASYALYCLNDTAKKILLVITDIIMPNTNGFEILKQIRSGDTRANRDLPVIMLSGDTGLKALNLAQRLDCNAYMTKPISYDEFMATVLRALDKEIALKPSRDYNQIDTSDVFTIRKKLLSDE